MGDNGNSSEPLEVLIASGTVRGTCLLKRGEVIYEKFPYSAARLVKVCRIVDGLTKEFKEQGRTVDQMAFGFEGGNLLAVNVKNYRLIIMHLMSDEIDFLAQAARACLKDIIAEDKDSDEEDEASAKSKPSKGTVSIDTVPITLAKNRQAAETKVEETTRVEILQAPSVPSSPSVSGAPSVPGAPHAPDSESDDDGEEAMSPENISLGI